MELSSLKLKKKIFFFSNKIFLILQGGTSQAPNLKRFLYFYTKISLYLTSSLEFFLSGFSLSESSLSESSEEISM